MSAIPNIISREGEHRRPADFSQASAFMVNPEVSVSVLVAAASGWAQTLSRTLTAWNCVTNAGMTDAQELGFLLEPMAQQLEMLMDEIGNSVARGDAAAASDQGDHFLAAGSSLPHATVMRGVARVKAMLSDASEACAFRAEDGRPVDPGPDAFDPFNYERIALALDDHLTDALSDGNNEGRTAFLLALSTFVAENVQGSALDRFALSARDALADVGVGNKTAVRSKRPTKAIKEAACQQQ